MWQFHAEIDVRDQVVKASADGGASRIGLFIECIGAVYLNLLACAANRQVESLIGVTEAGTQSLELDLVVVIHA